MPAPDIKDRSLWIKSKINDGLMSAEVPQRQREWVEATFIGLPRPTQQALIDGVGGFGIFASEKDKEKRDLCRAMNAALAFEALLHGQRYVYDRAWRDKIMTRLDLSAARKVVLAQVNAAYAAAQPFESSEPITLPGPEPVLHTPMPVPVLPVSNPISARVDQPGAGWKKARLAIASPAVKQAIKQAILMNRVHDAVEAFQAGGTERREGIDALTAQHAGQLGVVWSRASTTVAKAIQDISRANDLNLGRFNNAITNAYQSFDQHVKDNQGLLKKRVQLVGKLFGALKCAPPPLSYIGAIGATVAGCITVQDGLDQRNKFASLQGAKSSGFYNKLLVRFDALREEKLRVGPDLTVMASTMSLQETLFTEYRTSMKGLEDVLQATCDEHFGTTSEVLAKFRAEVGNVIEKNYSSIQGRTGIAGQHAPARELEHADAKRPPAAQVNVEKLIIDHIVAYQNELLQEMRPAIKLPELFAPDEAGYAIEMLLYSNYICAMYENKLFLGKPIASGISNFFAREAPWGVLMLNSSQDESASKHRLKWEDDDNHRKTLWMFCDWYLLNINPFMLITRGMRDGKPYTPELIHALCVAQIDKINAAIKAGRSKGKLITSWNWKTIETEYARLCAT